MHAYYVYILSNKTHTVLYIGITSNLPQRIHQHKKRAIEGFTSRYNVQRLVWFTTLSQVKEAIALEKKLKGWRREKKEWLIASMNPEWKDLSSELKFLYCLRSLDLDGVTSRLGMTKTTCL